jgi:hypothetical protein
VPRDYYRAREKTGLLEEFLHLSVVLGVEFLRTER